MNIKSAELIEEFYQENEDSPLSLEEVKLICKSQFDLVAKEMESGYLRNIRLKYFATFVVYPGRVRHLNNYLDRQLQESTISTSDYERLKAMYLEYENRRS